jgi:hypothetical protein
MAESIVIVPTIAQDIPTIYWLFDEAIVYQKNNDYPVWPGYDKDTLDEDIAQHRQFKILIDGEIAGIFTILDSDPIVWREKNAQPAVYLHRVVVNPKHKGKKLFGDVLKWTSKRAQNLNIDLIRMDTWADNPVLVSYYQQFDFKIVEYYTTPNTLELPLQQRGNNVVLLEHCIPK